jgi:transcriptional regulator CtsR
VPSQINYVISTRFSPEHGYIVESRRGGNGYIRIRRAKLDARQIVMHAVNAIGDSIDAAAARAFVVNLAGAGAIERGAAHLMTAAVGDSALKALPTDMRDVARAGIFKQMLISTVCTER